MERIGDDTGPAVSDIPIQGSLAASPPSPAPHDLPKAEAAPVRAVPILEAERAEAHSTHPTNEFATLHRVHNWHTCNGCWNDPGLRFDHGDFLWCPRHAGTARQFECTRLIAPEMVLRAIDRVPGIMPAATPRSDPSIPVPTDPVPARQSEELPA